MSPVTTEAFKRARTDEQRALRRTLILQVTRDLLTDHRIADLSLNEIARQVGLAKSNVLRYFESREAILLTLLQEEYAAWVAEVAQVLPASSETDPHERVAAVLARTIMARPLLCELLTATPTVLEHNVTTEEVIAFKVAVQGAMTELLATLEEWVGFWNEVQAGVFFSSFHAVVTGTWALANPAPALVEAYRSHSSIHGLPCTPEAAVREALGTLLIGLKHRTPRWN